MYFTYILESEKSGRLYIGQTNNVIERIKRHNSGNNISTKNKGPWKLIFHKNFETRSEAYQMEQKLKAFKNPQKIKDWINKDLMEG